jgi:hypothetical protein
LESYYFLISLVFILKIISEKKILNTYIIYEEGSIMDKKEPEIFTSLKKFVELAEKLKETMIEYDNLQSANEKNNCSENQKKTPHNSTFGNR